MEVTFSMQRLSRIEAECQHYMSEIQRMHRQRQEQRENEVNGRNSHRFFFCFFFRAWIWWKCASRTHWLAKEKKYVKRHKEHVFLFTHGLDVSLFHYWFNSNRSRSAKNYFQNESIFWFFFKFFGAFFKTSKRGSIGIPYHNTVQRKRSWNEILDGFPPISNNTKRGSFYFFSGILNHRLKES